MLHVHAKFRGNPSTSFVEEDILKGLYHIWAWLQFWLCDQHHFFRNFPVHVPLSLLTKFG